MSVIDDDHRWMRLALELAARGRFTAKPNPAVGCVIVKDGVLLGEGWHYRAGSPHAEVNAIASAKSKVFGATAYVTLEPCNHTGKTGPCTQALINAGIKRVVIAMLDPNPLVSGKGMQALKQVGMDVEAPLVNFEQEAKELNLGFISRMERQRPWVRCKQAISLDGKTAMASGESQWITGSAARSDVQLWRAQSSAIVTGIDSVLLDDSRLSLREEELVLPDKIGIKDVISLAPIRIVLDTQLRIPVNASILNHNARTLILTSERTYGSEQKKVAMLKSIGGHVEVETLDINEAGHLCLEHLLKLLNERECNELLIEAGATLAGAFLRSNLIDEFIIYQAPILLGSLARPMLDLQLESMSEKVQLKITDRLSIGNDERIIARVTTAA